MPGRTAVKLTGPPEAPARPKYERDSPARGPDRRIAGPDVGVQVAHAHAPSSCLSLGTSVSIRLSASPSPPHPLFHLAEWAELRGVGAGRRVRQRVKVELERELGLQHSARPVGPSLVHLGPAKDGRIGADEARVEPEEEAQRVPPQPKRLGPAAQRYPHVPLHLHSDRELGAPGPRVHPVRAGWRAAGGGLAQVEDDLASRLLDEEARAEAPVGVPVGAGEHDNLAQHQRRAVVAARGEEVGNVGHVAPLAGLRHALLQPGVVARAPQREVLARLLVRGAEPARRAAAT